MVASLLMKNNHVYNIYDLLKCKKRKMMGASPLMKYSHVYSGRHLLREEDYGLSKNFCKMSKADFINLLHLVKSKIMKSDTGYRRAIPVIERLVVFTILILLHFALVHF